MLPLAILAGGFATRLGSLSKDFPKCLIEINGRPFVDWQLDLLIKNGYSDFVFCLSYKSELVQDHLGDGSSWGARIQYSLDGESQLGTGGAIRNAVPKLGKEFGVIYGDSFLPIDYPSVETYFLNSEKQALMTIFENSNNYDQSNVQYERGVLLNYQKGLNDSKMRHIDYGLSYFKDEAFTEYPSEANFDLANLCHYLARTKKLDAFEVFQRFYEVGSISGISEFSDYLRRAEG